MSSFDLGGGGGYVIGGFLQMSFTANEIIRVKKMYK